MRGSIKDKKAKKVFSLADIRLYECPLSYISADTAELMRIVYLVDRSGHLLHPGGWAGQPCWLIEAYEIFMSEGIKEIKDKGDA